MRPTPPWLVAASRALFSKNCTLKRRKHKTCRNTNHKFSTKKCLTKKISTKKFLTKKIIDKKVFDIKFFRLID